MKINPTTYQYLRSSLESRKVITEAMKKKAKKAGMVTAAGGVVLLAVSLSLAFLVYQISKFYDEYKVLVNSPISVRVETRKLIEVEPRRLEVLDTYKQEIDAKIENIVKGEENHDLAKYICEKFGVENCKVALAVAKAESGLRCDAVNVNGNGSVDLGVFQLNNIHLKRQGWSLEKMGGCFSNVDLAYELWKEQGWTPWVAYTSGGWLSRVE